MRKEYMFIIISGILYGTITPGAQIFLNMGFSLLDVSFYRAFFISLLILPLFLFRPGYFFSLRMLPFFIVYGLIGGMLETAMFGSLYMGVPVPLVVFFLYTQPVWTIIIGKFFLKEPIYRKHIMAVIVGMTGVFILLRSWEVKTTESLIGLILALFSGFLLSLWVVWGKRSAKFRNHFITTTFGWSFFAAIWLFLFFVIFSKVYPGRSETLSISLELMISNFKGLIIFAVVAGVLPHLLFYRGLEEVNASSAGIILLLEPVSATIMAAFLFSESIGISFIAGACLILLSNYFVLIKKQGTAI